MLSRTADNLYWLARYVERAEYLARILDTTLRLTALPLAYVGAIQRMGIRGRHRRLRQAVLRRLFGGQRGDRHRIPRLLDRQSVLDPQLLRDRAPQRARGAHRADHRDVGRHQRRLARTAANGATARRRARNSPASCAGCMGTSLRFDGSAYRTMLRNDAYWFSRLGVYIERADNTARILDVKYHLLLPAQEQVGGPLDYFQWAAILRSVSALTAYHWVYRENVKPWLVADLLMLQGRDAALAGELLREPGAEPRPHRQGLRPQGPAQRQARAVRARLENSKIEEIFQNGLHEFIDDFVEDNNRLGSAVAQQYLL